jgi:hypothetical protein
MAESAKKVAEVAEQRMDDLAENVRNRFDRITKGRFSDQITAGRASDRVAAESGGGGGPAGQASTDQQRREQGESR